jgi:hypothetical protein
VLHVPLLHDRPLVFLQLDTQVAARPLQLLNIPFRDAVHQRGQRTGQRHPGIGLAGNFFQQPQELAPDSLLIDSLPAEKFHIGVVDLFVDEAPEK